MPTITQLCGARNLTSLRTPLTCKSTSALVRQGPATQPSGAPAWLLFLCIEHAQALPNWPGTPADPDDPPTMTCGAVLDFRSTDQVLQSHADLWLTPLTGVDPKMYITADKWADVLVQARRALAEQPEYAAGVGEPLNSLLMMLEIAVKNTVMGDLYQATVPLAFCETVSARLL
ncbi:hypothetical protein [Streptomyces sp. NBC_01361]|uniref:hypothetical protein n=1 Tax=Streptomyces sp. NBC_01361 TaxID=2903838 RepID=UPI002E309445|nr:hypothetical protein [Streptomyces sp. NBC_01361]